MRPYFLFYVLVFLPLSSKSVITKILLSQLLHVHLLPSWLLLRWWITNYKVGLRFYLWIITIIFLYVLRQGLDHSQNVNLLYYILRMPLNTEWDHSQNVNSLYYYYFSGRRGMACRWSDLGFMMLSAGTKVQYAGILFEKKIAFCGCLQWHGHHQPVHKTMTTLNLLIAKNISNQYASWRELTLTF